MSYWPNSFVARNLVWIGMVLVLASSVSCHRKRRTNVKATSAPADTRKPSAFSRLPPSTEIILRLAGSTTIGEPPGPQVRSIAQELAFAFLQSDDAPGGKHTNVDCKSGLVSGEPQKDEYFCAGLGAGGEWQAITISALGSGEGFKRIRNNGADIGMSSRLLKPIDGDHPSATPDPYRKAELVEEPIAFDAIAIIVHRDNPITRITRETLQRIYTRDIRDWSDVEGTKNGSITVVSRPFPDSTGKIPVTRAAASGTYEVFAQRILEPPFKNSSSHSMDPVRSDIVVAPTSAAVVEVVAKDRNAIAYVGLVFADTNPNVKAIAVGDEGQKLIPQPCAVATEEYLLSRRLYLYQPQSHSTTNSKTATEFLAFVRRDGRAVIPKAKAISRDIEQNCPSLEQMSTSLKTLEFAFNSAKLEAKAIQDIDEIVRKTSEKDQLVVIGFASREPNQRTQKGNWSISQERAEAVAKELEIRGRFVKFYSGAGDQDPVATNDSEEGRRYNRRVKVWRWREPGQQGYSTISVTSK